MICIEEAIQENGKLDYEMLTKKSHDEAWNNTRKNTQIDIIDIAKAGGADEEMIKYTREVLENKRIILK
jgi:predicted transcriptional regulator